MQVLFSSCDKLIFFADWRQWSNQNKNSVNLRNSRSIFNKYLDCNLNVLFSKDLQYCVNKCKCEFLNKGVFQYHSIGRHQNFCFLPKNPQLFYANPSFFLGLCRWHLYCCRNVSGLLSWQLCCCRNVSGLCSWQLFCCRNELCSCVTWYDQQ